MRFFLGAILARSFLASAFLSTVTLQANAITLTPFTSPNSVSSLANLGAIGFTYAGDKFVGSVYSGGQLYSGALNGGNVATFGPAGVLNAGQFEHYLTSSLGIPGFPNGDIYVADVHGTQNSIVHITNNGNAYNTFVTLPTGSGTIRGMLFDSIGTFRNTMLVSTSLGNIYEVNSGGVVVNSSGNPSVLPLVSFAEDAEGMAVLPKNASFLPGSLIVTSENSGLLRAVAPAARSRCLTRAIRFIMRRS
jgi:hypothetical protein